MFGCPTLDDDTDSESTPELLENVEQVFHIAIFDTRKYFGISSSLGPTSGSAAHPLNFVLSGESHDTAKLVYVDKCITSNKEQTAEGNHVELLTMRMFWL